MGNFKITDEVSSMYAAEMSIPDMDKRRKFRALMNHKGRERLTNIKIDTTGFELNYVDGKSERVEFSNLLESMWNTGNSLYDAIFYSRNIDPTGLTPEEMEWVCCTSLTGHDYVPQRVFRANGKLVLEFKGYGSRTMSQTA